MVPNVRKLHELGSLQRELMDILWRKGPSTVHQLIAEMPLPPHYVTVLTVMRRLRDRGLVTAEKEVNGSGPAHFLFTSAVTREEAQRAILSSLVPSVFPIFTDVITQAYDLRSAAIDRENGVG